MNIREKMRNYRRVVQIARKPNREEFTSTSKVTAIGISVIGVIGFLIYLVVVLSGI